MGPWFLSKKPSLSVSAVALHDFPKLKEEARCAFNKAFEPHDIAGGQFPKFLKSESTATREWLMTALRSNTGQDRICAMAYLINMRPTLCLRYVDTLITLINPAKQRDCFQAIDALYQLWERSLMPKNRTLIQLNCRPFGILSDMTESEKEETLSLWFFEDELKARYLRFIKALERLLMTDTVEGFKRKALSVLSSLVCKSPENRSLILSVLINKLGDRSKVLASCVIHKLRGIAGRYPTLLDALVEEVRSFLFRPNLLERAKYYAISLLSCLELRTDQKKVDDTDLASNAAIKLVKIYAAFFHATVKSEEIPERLATALLAGLSRAAPFIPDDRFSEYVKEVDDIFRLVHTTTFNVSLQALAVLFQISSHRAEIRDRYYQALYRKLRDPSVLQTSRGPTVLHLVYRSMLGDPDADRRAAFAQRLLQICLLHPQPGFIVGVLILLSKVHISKQNLIVNSQVPVQTKPIGTNPPTESSADSNATLTMAKRAVPGDDDDDEEEEELDDEDPKVDGEPTTGESAAAFERRSLRIRRSIDKAKAALPADFADRIGVAPELSDSVFRDRSGTRPSGMRLGNNEMDDTAVQPTGEEFNISDDEVDPTAQVPVADGDYANYPHPSPEHRKSTMHEESRDSYIEPDDRSASTSSSSKGPSTYMSQSGILWRSEHPQPLEELVARFRTNPPGSTYLTKAISQRSGCRCALCGHDSLLLFPVLDASLALASWASWSLPNKSHTRASSGYDRNGGMASAFATVSEIQAQLAVFRQCRGWYEVLNENQQAIPHLTTVEQFRRAKPSTFLIRRDLKCLAAPPTLLVPPLNDTRSTGDGAPPVPFPSSVVAIATASDTLMNSVQEIIPAGTLMHFVTYLPHCPVKRGRKIKELGLILATKRIPGSPIRRSRTGEMGNANNLPSRAYYIGLEDSTPAVFPSRFSISPVAGPENISGVHSLASVLRKFRLPISVRPVYAPEGGGSGGSSLLTSDQAERTSNGSYSRSSGMNPNPFQCGLSAVPGLQFSDRHYLRLLSLCRGDILIFAPISSPERLFLITPSMLRDHVFQLGSASDPAYEQLLEGHRMQSINFLASAHPRDSLNYLVRHMRDITREPRESYATRQTNRNKSDTMRGADSNNPPEMTQEELCQAYDELDDIYFFIRHGYYPPKNRRPETPIKTVEPTSTSRSAKNSISIPNQPGAYEQTETETMPRRPDAVSAVRTSVPTAEQLLAASLKTPVRNHSFQTRWTNGSGNVASTYRIQPKEYGI